MSFLTLFSLITLCTFAQIELTPDDFDSVVDGSKHVFVMFYAPWCGHCKNFKPEYAKVAATFEGEADVVVASVDADKHKDLGSKFGVTGFPTLKFFEKSTKPTDYSGGRTAQDVVSFLNGKSGLSKEVKEPPTLVTVLKNSNFKELALGEKAALVEFYAPWCGHCKNLAPTYEEVAKAFLREKGVVIGKVDATVESELASSYDVKGYPTLKFFPAGSDKPVDYNGGRDLKSFVNYINQHAGTRRNPQGGLELSAGRVPELDTLANIFLKKEGERDAISKQMEDYCKNKPEIEFECKFYLKYAEKVKVKGEKYPEKESARLRKMAKSGSVQEEKKDGMRKRANILEGFMQGPESLEDVPEVDDKIEL